ncbi:hypothetical protein K501DRAFT_281230, partial [Backusella circina FSU 941]
EENPVGQWKLYIIDAKNANTTGELFSWKLTLYGEVTSDEYKHTFSNSYLEEEKPSPYLIYGIVAMFMIVSVASTAFIIKKYMFKNDVVYTAPLEDDEAYEFENLLSNIEEDEEEEESDEDSGRNN